MPVANAAADAAEAADEAAEAAAEVVELESGMWRSEELPPAMIADADDAPLVPPVATRFSSRPAEAVAPPAHI